MVPCTESMRQSKSGRMRGSRHALRIRSAEEGLVALADDPAESGGVNAAFEQHTGERLLRQRQLSAGLHAFAFRDAPLDDLLPARLHREVVHREGDFRFARVAVLGDEVAGVAGQRDVLDAPGGAFPSPIILLASVK